jgi:hypothetical protein
LEALAPLWSGSGFLFATPLQPEVRLWASCPRLCLIPSGRSLAASPDGRRHGMQVGGAAARTADLPGTSASEDPVADRAGDLGVNRDLQIGLAVAVHVALHMGQNAVGR